MQLIDEGVIFEGRAGSSTANCGFSAIAQLPDGTLIATWRVGSDKGSPNGDVWAARSTDGGRTWSSPGPLFVNPQFEFESGEIKYAPLTALGGQSVLATGTVLNRDDPTASFIDPKTEQHVRSRPFWARSDDAGRTWGPLREINPSPYEGLPLVAGPMKIMPDGRWGCWFEVDQATDWHHALAKFSGDGGQTWGGAIDVAHDPTNRYLYWDQRIAVGRDGRCAAMFWTHDTQRGEDATIHLAESADGGLSWSAPRDTALSGQVAHPVWMTDRRLAVVYVDRFGTHTIRVGVSEDGGVTFSGDELAIYRHTTPQADPKTDRKIDDSAHYTFGRPDALADPDGTIWIVYYAGGQTLTRMHWAHVAV